MTTSDIAATENGHEPATADRVLARNEAIISGQLRARWPDIIMALSPLRIAGTAMFCLLATFFVAPALTPFSERAGVWALYLALGTLFPLAVGGGILLERTGRALPAPLSIVLITVPIAAAAIAAGPLLTVVALGLAQVQTLVSVAIVSRHERITLVRVVSLFVIGFIAWAAVLAMFAWDSMRETLPPSWILLLVGAIALVACCWWAFGTWSGASRGRLPVQRIVDLACLVLLVLLAFRTDGLFTTDRLGEDGTFYHWGTLVGAAEATRHGGWLLWDVPSPYGFLTMVSLAALPTTTTWQSLYLLNAITSALLAIWLFLTLRAVQPRLAGSLLALSVTAAVIFLASTYPPTLAPEHYFPMSGAFRYGWCYVLIGMLLLERRVSPRSRDQRLILLACSICWLLSMLWSAESAFYGSAVWIPAFIVIVLRDYGGLHRERRWTILLAWLAVPPLLLAAAGTAIVLIFRRSLGQGPDALSYVEAVLAFGGSRASDVSGLFAKTGFTSTTGVIVFGFLMLAVVAASVARTNAGLRDLPTGVGLALGLWGLLSYPVGQPFSFTIYRLMPFLVLGLAIVLAIMAPRYRGASNLPWINVIKVGTVALLTALLASTYTNVTELRYYADAIRNEDFLGRDVSAGLPHVDPSLDDLLLEAGVAATDPIFYAGATYGDMMPVWTPAGTSTPVVTSRQWLTGQVSTMVFLPDSRKQTYMARIAERRPTGGWLIERRQRDDLIYAIDEWFFEQVNKTHVPTKIAVNNDWQIVWYDPIGSTAVASRPLPAALRVPGLPADLWINAQSLDGAIFPEVWGFFGPEWTEPTTTRTWRCATAGGGTLHIFTPSPREARLILGFPDNTSAAPLRVTVNEAPAVETESTRTGKASAAILLEAGWNAIGIEPVDLNQTSPAVTTTIGCDVVAGAASSLRINYFEIRFRS